MNVSLCRAGRKTGTELQWVKLSAVTRLLHFNLCSDSINVSFLPFSYTSLETFDKAKAKKKTTSVNAQCQVRQKKLKNIPSAVNPRHTTRPDFK